MTDDGKNNRPDADDLAQILFDRAHSAGIEFHKLLVSLATGIVAALAIVLTREIEPQLSNMETFLVIVTLASSGLTVLLGIASWLTDYYQYQTMARALRHRWTNTEKYKARKAKWQRLDWYVEIMLVLFFLLGVFSAVAFVALRAIR